MHEYLPSTKVILFAKLSDLPEYKDSFMNIKLDYCKCIRIYEKANLRSDFRKVYFQAGARTHKSITLVKGKKCKCKPLIMNTF